MRNKPQKNNERLTGFCKIWALGLIKKSLRTCYNQLKIKKLGRLSPNLAKPRDVKNKITMRANLYMVALSMLILPLIYFINGEEKHWSQLIPLAYIVYAFIIGTISAFRKR